MLKHDTMLSISGVEVGLHALLLSVLDESEWLLARPGMTSGYEAGLLKYRHERGVFSKIVIMFIKTQHSCH